MAFHSAAKSSSLQSAAQNVFYLICQYQDWTRKRTKGVETQNSRRSTCGSKQSIYVSMGFFQLLTEIKDLLQGLLASRNANCALNSGGNTDTEIDVTTLF